MLEADVQMRYNRTDTEPIMAHPPSLDSNLTLAEFINKVSKTQKGIKLDFKSIMAVEPSLKLLKNISDAKRLEIPIWLNADIFQGPCYDKVCMPVDAKQFIKHCTQYFPSSVLSIGWTTGNDMKPEENKYSWQHVLEMGKMVVDIKQPVTFPVRASLIKRSLPQLLWLIDISKNLTLTVWSSVKDTVNAPDLVELRKSVYNKKNVYYDLPEPQAAAFAKALEGVDTSTQNPYHPRQYGELKGYAVKSCSDVIVGETKVMFTGKGGWVSTTKEVKTFTDPLSTVHFDMEVSFLSLDTPNIEQNITMVIGSSGVTGSNQEFNPQEGIQFVLQRTGKVTIIKPDGTKIDKKVKADPNFQYRLGFYHGNNMKGLTINANSKAGTGDSVYFKYEGDFKPKKQFVVLGVGEQAGGVLVERVSSAISLPAGSGVVPSLNIAMYTIAAMIIVLLSYLVGYIK